MKGKIIKLDNTTVVPYEQGRFGWFCVVIASANKSYPVGGYNVFVMDEELKRGKEQDSALLGSTKGK